MSIIFILVDIDLWQMFFTSFLNPLTAAICRPFLGQKLSAARARELFKPFTDSASLLVDIEKNVFRFQFGVFWR